MSDILYDCAKAFEDIMKYNYIFKTARSNKQFVIKLNCLEGEITHIAGLDHLKDMEDFSSKNYKIKASTFQKILSGKIRIEDILQSEYFDKPFYNTYNSCTRSEYTLTERLFDLQYIEKILDTAYTGKLYKWDTAKANIKMPDGKDRRLSIRADYMIAVPSEKNPDEKIYLFLYIDKKSKGNKNSPIHLHLFSAFADCLDLSQGQERPFTILEEQKENAHTHQFETLYISPSYKRKTL